MNIYIGNLSFDIKEEDIHSAFSGFGEVASIKLITDQYSGRLKGFGFVEMPDRAEAEAAIKSLDSSELKGRKIRVNPATPRRDDRKGDRGGRQGGFNNRSRY